MADVYKGLTVRLGADTSSLSSALRKARSEVSGVASDLRMVEKALKIDPGNVNLLAQQQKDYQKQIKATEEQLRIFRAAEEQALAGDIEMSDEQWTKLQSDIVMCEQKLKGYKQALTDSMVKQQAANTLIGQFGDKLLTASQRLERVGSGMQTVGRGLTTGVTLPITAAGYASVKAATDIDTSLTNVKKTVDGTESEYRQLKEAAVEFSKVNAVEADQLLDIQALGAQLGFAIDELDEFSEVVSGLDIATNMDAETAATEMAQFANITKMAHADVSNYGSAIVGLGNSFATTEADISSMAMRLAAAGTQVGMSQADILGLATALSSMGVEAEAGGTAISTVMSQIDKDIATNSAAVETWASTAGMSAQQFADAWRSDPVAALSALFSNMEKATAEGGNMSVMLEELGIDAVRQTDIMKRLAGNSELVGKAVAKANQEWNANTALSKEVENRNQSLAAKFQILKNKVTAVAADVGGPLADALLDTVDAAEPLIQAIASGAKAFSEMDEEEQRVILSVVALSAALGPLLNVTGKVLVSSESLGKAMESLSERSVKAGGAAGVLSKGLAGATIALTAMFAAMTVREIMKMREHTENLTEATDGLRAAVTGADGSMRASVDAFEVVASAADGTALSVEELAEKQAQLAQAIADTNNQAATDVASLQQYGETVSDLAGRSDLTEEELARLNIALDGVNSACGTSYEVVQDAGGAYQVMADGAVVAKDAINDLIAAQEAQIRFDAASSNYKEALEAEAEAAASLAEALRQQAEAQQKCASAAGESIEAQAAYGDELALANQRVAEATALHDAAADAVAYESDQMTLSRMAMEEGASAYTSFVESNALLQESVMGSGQSLLNFRTHLEETGVSTQLLGSLTDEELARIGASYDGTVDSVSAALGERLASQLLAAGASTQDLQDLTSEQLALLVQSYDGNIETTKAKLEEFAAANRAKGYEGGSGLATGTARGIEDNAGEVEAAAEAMADAAEDAASEFDTESLGRDFTNGFASGVGAWSAVRNVCNAAAGMVKSAIQSAKDAQDSASPAKETKKLGGDFGDGYIVGIDEKIRPTIAKAKSLAESALSALSGKPSTTGGASMSSSARTAASLSVSKFVTAGSLGQQAPSVNVNVTTQLTKKDVQEAMADALKAASLGDVTVYAEINGDNALEEIKEAAQTARLSYPTRR